MARFTLLFLVTLFSVITLAQNSLTDDEVAQSLIEQSIQNYSGRCACPYQSAKNGSRCGKRSAYSKPGGYNPLCYKSDITKEMIKKWREYQQ